MASEDFKKRTFEIFGQLNRIPRPSHHEEKAADFLCAFAEGLGLEYERDAQNCVVIRKRATPGHEGAETVVLLNHMDMVAVSDGSRPFDPLSDGVEPYVEDGWMKARGTSLGADNGIGLSMALAVLADDTLVHGPLEVLTTTNEEDGMSGAAAMSPDFVRGRKVINLDSEDYDTITVGAAGAYLQRARFKSAPKPAAEGTAFFEISLSGGLGGHSGVDIGKGRTNAIRALADLICTCAASTSPQATDANPAGEMATTSGGSTAAASTSPQTTDANAIGEMATTSGGSIGDIAIVSISGGSASASIPSSCTATVGIAPAWAEGFEERLRERFARMRGEFSDGEGLTLTVSAAEGGPVIAGREFLELLLSLPCGVIRMHDALPGTVMTSNNIGTVRSDRGGISVTCHTRSFSDDEMVRTAEGISASFSASGADVEVLMNTPGWQENPDSGFLALTDSTFRDVLGFSPRKVAMHFVLEAGYYVRKFPGIEIACIGPRIVEPHSTSERVCLSTVTDICDVLVEMLSRLAFLHTRD